MISRYTISQIAGYIEKAANTEMRQPYKDDLLIRSAKAIMRSISENSNTEEDIRSEAQTAMSYFASNVETSDLDVLITVLRSHIYQPA